MGGIVYQHHERIQRMVGPGLAVKVGNRAPDVTALLHDG